MLLMMGTADSLPQAPTQKTVFMEDMTDQQLASAVSSLSVVLLIEKRITAVIT